MRMVTLVLMLVLALRCSGATAQQGVVRGPIVPLYTSTMRIEGQRFTGLIVDTGASLSLLPAGDLAKIQGKVRVEDGHGKVADGRVVPMLVYLVPRVTLAGCELRNVYFGTLTGGSRGLIGLQALRKIMPLVWTQHNLLGKCPRWHD